MPRFIEFYSLDVCQLIFLRQNSVPVSFIYWLYLCSFPLAIRRGLNKDACQSPPIAQTSSCGISQSESLVTVLQQSIWVDGGGHLFICFSTDAACVVLLPMSDMHVVWHFLVHLSHSNAHRSLIPVSHDLLPWHDCGEGAQPSCWEHNERSF